MLRNVALWLMGGALLAACAVQPAPQPALPPAPDQPIQSTPAAEAAQAGTTGTELGAGTDSDWLIDAQTYRDDAVGFEVRYPAGWDLIDVAPEVKQNSLGYAVTLNSWPRQEAGGGGIPEGGSKIDILVNRSAPANPADAAAIRRDELAQDPSNLTISNEDEIALGVGLPATRWEVEGPMGKTVEIVTATNGYTVIFSGMGDLALVEEIARTMLPFQ